VGLSVFESFPLLHPSCRPPSPYPLREPFSLLTHVHPCAVFFFDPVEISRTYPSFPPFTLGFLPQSSSCARCRVWSGFDCLRRRSFVGRTGACWVVSFPPARFFSSPIWIPMPPNLSLVDFGLPTIPNCSFARASSRTAFDEMSSIPLVSSPSCDSPFPSD